MQNLGAITLPESEGKFAKQIWEGENLKTTLKFEYFTRFYAHS